MSKIIINHKICDRSPECGGIAICPNKALTYDENLKKIIWNESRCTFCLKCTLPNSCPVEAIIFARDEDSEKIINNRTKNDTRTSKWLWKERFGVQPGKPRVAKILDNSNFTAIFNSPKEYLIDVWHEKYLDCRLHSALYQDLFKGVGLTIYKLDAQKYPELAEKLKVNTFPSLVIIKDRKVITIHAGYIEEKEIETVNNSIKKLLIN